MGTEVKLTRAQQLKAARERYKSRSDSQIYEDRLRLHPDGKKKCGGPCRQQKPLDQFRQELRTPDGLTHECKGCESIRRKRLAKKMSERTSEQIEDDAKRLRPSGDKYCSGCQTVKSVAEFAKSVRTGDGYNPICNKCVAIKSEIHKARLADMRDELRRRGCIVCGLKDIRCIDLAHRNREDKLKPKKGPKLSPSQIQGAVLLENELKLVDPKCANCHAFQTHEENQKLKLLSKRNPWEAAWQAKQRLPVNTEKTNRGGCVDCKLQVQDRFWLFDFDHVRGKKVKNIAAMVGKFSLSAIILEMTKCELRCKNCHRIATHERRQNQI